MKRNNGYGTIEERGKRSGRRYYLRLMENGERKCVRIFFANGDTPHTRAEAEDAVKQRYGEVLAAKSERVLAEVKLAALEIETTLRCSMPELWERCSGSMTCKANTLKAYRNYWQTFSDYVGKVLVDEVTPAQAEEFLRRYSEEKSARSYNAMLQTLHMFFNYAVENKLCAENPFKKLKKRVKDTHSHRNFTEEQVEAIFKYIDTDACMINDKAEIRTLMMVCCWTGCRKQDAALLKWQNIDMTSGMIEMCPEKTRTTSGKSVAIPMHSKLRAELELAAARTGCNGYVVPRIAERYLNPATSSGVSASCQLVIGQALGVDVRVKLDGRKQQANCYGLHSFRHTFISFCASAGVPMEIVKAMVGHSTDVTRIYTHISTGALRKAIDTLEDKDNPRRRLAELAASAPLEIVQQALEMMERTAIPVPHTCVF